MTEIKGKKLAEQIEKSTITKEQFEAVAVGAFIILAVLSVLVSMG
jgi:hypothetical protein